MANPVGVEQRRFPRVPFQRGVRFRSQDTDLFCGQAARDISQGGIRINSESFIPAGSTVMLQIQLEGEGRLINLSGRVAWARFLSSLDKFQIGIEFSSDIGFGQWKIARYVVSTQ